MNIFFRSAGHKQRFLSTINQIGKIYDGKLDPEYASALYILTSTSGSWLKAASYVSRHGIDFEELLTTAYSSGERVMIDLAGNLFNGQTVCSPVDLMGVDGHNFRIALDAMRLRYRNWSLGEFGASEE